MTIEALTEKVDSLRRDLARLESTQEKVVQLSISQAKIVERQQLSQEKLGEYMQIIAGTEGTLSEHAQRLNELDGFVLLAKDQSGRSKWIIRSVVVPLAMSALGTLGSIWLYFTYGIK